MTTKKPKDPHNFKEIGDYFVKDPLGEGVNGAVRLGVQKETGLKVALKFIAKMELTEKQAERLKREIRFLTLLYHPNIVRLYDVFETSQYYVLAMDRVRKGELLKYITDNGYIPENKFRGLFRQMLSAVNYCHQNSVVHRDLKPENILMDDNKNIKIIDFGLSNIFDGQNFLTTFCGSPKYAAPEIITGTKYIGPSVDMWSLGVILFAGLTGKLPFNGRTVESTYAKVLAGVVKYPSHLSQSAKDYLARFLVLDSSQRINMEEALTHPWIMETYNSPPELHLPPRPTIVSDPLPDVFSQLLEYGYTEKEARTALNDPAPGPIKNTYYLLLEKKSREQKTVQESVSRERFSFSNLLRHSLKSRKGKFDKDGFLLDVTYITAQIIRMSHPVETVDSLFMNPLKEVQKFFDRYHKDRFKIFNLCPSDFAGYSPEKFNNCVVRYPVPDDAVPSMQTLYNMCVEIDEYLNKSNDNVIAIHGKQDMARPAIAICAYLLHSHFLDTVDEVISYFTDKMYPVEEKAPKNLFTPSMKRYLHYYMEFTRNNYQMPRERLLCISSIELNAIPNFDVYGGCDPFAKIKMNGTVMVNVKKTVPVRHFSEKKDSTVRIICDTVPVSGDIQISVLDRDPLYAETMFSLCLNLSFLEDLHTVIPGEPDTEIDDDDGDNGFVVVNPGQNTKGTSVSNRFSIVLPKSQLDIDKKFLDRFSEEFAATITFTEPSLGTDGDLAFQNPRRLSSFSNSSG